jgi:hypothetical protein
MKTKAMFWTIVLLLSAFTGSVFGATEGDSNNFFGGNAGANFAGGSYDTFIGGYAGYSNTTGNWNTFLGNSAGYSNTTGQQNTFLGLGAGYSNTTGNLNTFVGDWVGRYNTTGQYNIFLGPGAGYSNTTGNYNTFLGVDAGIYHSTGSYNIFIGPGAGFANNGSNNIFLGNQAGQNETGSNKLYIDYSQTSTPLIYGEFDTRNLTINGNLEVIGPYQGLLYLSNTTDDSTVKVSRMVLNHYSNAQLPVYLFGAASTADNNFVAFGGGNTIGNAATQLDFFTAENPTTPVGTPRLTIIGNGYVGIGIQNPEYPLDMASGAYVTTGGVWTNASSREYKDNIEALTTDEAFGTLKGLNPVKYAYKKDLTEKHVGFIAEEAPDLVATKDRKGLSSMDIVAVLTKVVQEQQKTMQEQQRVAVEQQRVMQEQQNAISTLSEELKELKEKVR